MAYSAEQIQQLDDGYAEIAAKCEALVIAYLEHPYTGARALEYASNGFSRRLQILERCIENVYVHLPPELGALPERDVRHDATINLHAFIFNVFGAIDNLAWIWVSEKVVTREDGRPLSPFAVGFGEKNTVVRASFPQGFQDYLVTRKPWFDHLENYRHALAHRIPLYIPPHIVPPERVEAYAALEHQRMAPNLGAAEFDRLSAAQNALVSFEPIMMHSFGENAPRVPFHIQMLQDFNTIDELGWRVLDELRR